MLDLVIRGGFVVDGTGSPGRHADLGISDGQLVRIGDVADSASRVIDASGLVVAPGFVDIHTHYDPHVLWDPHVTPSSLHGVTTVIGGNCGFSLAPINEHAASYLLPMLAKVEGMPLASLEAAVKLRWSTFGDWLNLLDGQVSINIGFLAGHSTIRRVVMGDDAVGRQATSRELAMMEHLLETSLREGALGFSSSWGSAHTDAAGQPVPSRWASKDELLALCRVVRGVPGTNVEFIPPKATEMDTAIYELLTDMSLAAQRAVNWNLLRVRASEDGRRLLDSQLGASDYATAAGAPVVPLTLPESLTTMVNPANPFLFDSLPGWNEIMSQPLAARLAAFANVDVRRQLAEGASRSVKEIWNDWPSLRIAVVSSERLRSHIGQTVGDIAMSTNTDPFDTLLDLVVADDGRAIFETSPVDDDADSWSLRKNVIADSRVVIGGSDAGAHLDILRTYALHTRFLADVVRTRELLSLEEGIRLITDVPARFYGIRNRGRLSEGWQADLVMFDAATIGPGVDEVRNDLPAGGTRFFSTPTGVNHVIVNGIEVSRNGAPTGDLGGRVLRSGLDTESSPLANVQRL